MPGACWASRAGGGSPACARSARRGHTPARPCSSACRSTGWRGGTTGGSTPSPREPGCVLLRAVGLLVDVPPQIPAIAAQVPPVGPGIAHVAAHIAAVGPEVTPILSRLLHVTALHVLPDLPAVLSDVLHVALDVPAVAAQLTPVR